MDELLLIVSTLAGGFVFGVATFAVCLRVDFEKWSGRLERIEQRINQLKEAIMGKFDDVTGLLTAVNDATNAVAARIDKLIAQIGDTSGGLTAEQADAVVAGLTAERDRLTALAADPENPVPEPPANP